MRLIEEWEIVALHAWSMRCIYLATVLNAICFAMPFVAPGKPSWIFAGLAFLVNMGAGYLRLRSQPKLASRIASAKIDKATDEVTNGAV